MAFRVLPLRICAKGYNNPLEIRLCAGAEDEFHLQFEFDSAETELEVWPSAFRP